MELVWFLKSDFWQCKVIPNARSIFSASPVAQLRLPWLSITRMDTPVSQTLESPLWAATSGRHLGLLGLLGIMDSRTSPFCQQISLSYLSL